MADATIQRVEKAIQGIIGLIDSYTSGYTRPDITSVTKVLEPLQASDFPLLYAELDKLASSPLGEIRFNSLSEIMSDAEAARQFAEMGGGHLSEGMSEWYDNEARSAARSSGEEIKVIDSITHLVQMVEEKKKTS